jgi:soluble lytic murein transglycosylase-like protein
MSAPALTALEPLAATGIQAGSTLPGPEAGSAATAAERVRQLSALLAEVEHPPGSAGSSVSGTSPTFASALDAAQAESPGAIAPGAQPVTAAAEPILASISAPSTTAPSTFGPSTFGPSTSGPMTPGLLASSPSTSAPPTSSHSTSGSLSSTPYASLITQAAARYGIDPTLLAGLIQQESGFDPSARSGAGAVGLTQLMPSTAASLGVSEPLDPAQSIEGGARYLAQMLGRFAGNPVDALAAYNAGPGAVEQYGGVPPYPETQQYVTKVLGYAASFSGGEPQAVPATLYAGATGGVQSAAVPPAAAPVASGVIV